jgi:uncharacterized protein (DUF885 family)
VIACGAHPKPKEPAMHDAPSPLAADAVAGIADPALRAVVAEHWEHSMRWAPAYATTVGDHRFDDRLAPRDAAAVAVMRGERDALLARLDGVDRARLGDTDRTTLDLLRERLAADRGLDVCEFHEWIVDAGGSSLFGELSYVVESHVVHAARDADNVVARMTFGETLVAQTIGNLERGLAAGRVASAEKVRRAIAQLDGELAKPIAEWAMVKPAWAATYPAAHARLATLVEQRLAPAFAR